MTKGTISRVFEGRVPTAESLTAVCRVENVSLSWLLDGKGAPYLVGRCESDEECAERLGEFLEEKGWTIHLLTDGNRYAIVLTQPASFLIKERTVEYTACETLTGPIAGDTLAAVMQASPKYTTDLTRINKDQFARLISGEMGSYELLTKNGGLLNTAEHMTLEREVVLDVGVAEDKKDYLEDEKRLINAYRKLDAPLKAAALAAVEAMSSK